MGLHNVLLISELPADFYTLTAALERAQPERFQTRTVTTSEQPVDALLDPENDAIILAYTVETEYLLRLARKNELLTPIIVMLDQSADVQIDKLKQAGAIDHIVRGLVNDDMLHRILDYAIALKESRREQLMLLREQERLRDEASLANAAAHAANTAGAANSPANNPANIGDSVIERAMALADSPGPATSRVAAPETARQRPQAQPSPPLAAAAPAARTPISIWATVGAATLLVMVTAAIIILSQRLLNDQRLTQLESSSNRLVEQVEMLWSELAATGQELAQVKTGPNDNTPPAAPTAPALAGAAGGNTESTPAESLTETVTEAVIEPLPAIPTAPEPEPEPEPQAAAQPAPPATAAPNPVAAVPATVIAEPVASPAAATPPGLEQTDPARTATQSTEEELVLIPEPPASQATTGATESWFVNLGSFGRQASADSIAERVTGLPWDCQVSAIDRNGRTLYRVRLVNLPSRAAALQAATDYQSGYGGDRPWIGKN